MTNKYLEKIAETSLRKDVINATTGAGMGALTEHFVSKSKTPWIKGLSMGGKGNAAVINGVANVIMGRLLDKKAAIQGMLHEELGIPEDRNIPVNKLKSVIANTDSEATRKRAQFALNAKSWSHDKSAEQKYQMPLSDAIEEHKRLVAILKSNNRKKELEELKDQGGELREMLGRKH